MRKTTCRLALVAALTTTIYACQGAGSINLTNPLPALQSYLAELQTAVSPKQTVLDTASNATVQQQAAPDLEPYRTEFDATAKVWVVYYYSPSKGKSYRCQPNPDKTVTVTEVTDVNLVYQPGDKLDVNQVTVDPSAAASTAVAVAASPAPAASASPSAMPSASATPAASATPSAQATAAASPAASPTATPGASPSPSATPTAAASPTAGGTNVTNVNVTSVVLVSPEELRRKHHRHSSNPVYVVVTTTQTVYIDATTGKQVTEVDTTTTTTVTTH